MAVTSIHPIRATVSTAIRYIINPDKTVNGLYITSYLCRADSGGAAEDFARIRQRGTGRSTILAQHVIQSFKPDEITPEQALQVGEELCEKFLKGSYQYVLAVHTDHEHIHCHIVFNNTNIYSHRSFETEENQRKKSERAWAKLRNISDDICRENGLSVIDEPEKNKAVSHYERDMQKEGKSWKDKLRVRIAEIIYYSKDLEDFFKNCAESGIEYVYKPSNKHKLKFRMEGQERFTRAETLGEEYKAEHITEQIEVIQKLNRAKQHIAEMSKPRAAETPKPQVHKIPEIKQTAPIPQIPETKPTEKKEDKWADIRGMQNADVMIADLESAGIMSLDMLKSFFWNVKHTDDHSKDLPPLQEEIKALNTLISKMKHIAEIEPIYKEYQGKSGWSQSRFRKKNADTIEDYENTKKYILEHRKPYYVDGKPPKMIDLLDKSNALKSKYNKLSAEHDLFITKKTAAQKYTKQVKKYLDEQYMKHERERSQQRTYSHQKKKDTLE